jgi:D-beta-D-heptose 7-phosphate kinase/D-beta-D-heptose 1-phosphate adenosyltransferase
MRHYIKTDTTKKVLSLDRLLILIQSWRDNDETVVFTNGVFDLLHRGHLAVLEKSAAHGDRLIVGVNSDISARRLGKGTGRPLVSEIQRAEMMAGLEAVDAVVLFDEDTPFELLSSLKPDLLVKGADYKLEDIIGAEFVKRVERVDLVAGFSTSSLIAKIQQLKPTPKDSDVKNSDV